jgi:hypothetical protein
VSLRRGFALVVGVLACVLVDEGNWLNLLEVWTDYRRWLRREFGLRITSGALGSSASNDIRRRVNLAWPHPRASAVGANSPG